MGQAASLPAAVEPEVWQICFHAVAASRFWSLVACGRFKHVSAYAYVPGLRAWLFYDVTFAGTRLVLLPDTDEGLAVLAALTADCVVVRMRRADRPARMGRFGFWCVPAMKHLLRLRCGALRPDAFLRHLVAAGGEIVHGRRESTEHGVAVPGPAVRAG